MKRAGEALSVTILCLSAVLAWRLGFSLGASDVEKHILALISVALEGWKVLLPFVILKAWHQRRITAFVLATLLWPLLTAYSFIGGLGFSELNRASLAGTRGAAVERGQSLKTDIAAITPRLATIGTKRSPAEIESEIAQRRSTPIRAGANTRTLADATAQCTAIISKRSVELCTEIAALETELAQARQRENLDARLGMLRAELAQLSALDWEGVADPQVAVVAAVTGLTPQTTRQVINVVFATLIELIGGLGLFFASLLAPAASDAPRPISTPRDTPDPTPEPESDEQRLARYLVARTEPQDGTSVVASKLHADYSRWAHADGADPVSLTTFGNLIAKAGIAKVKLDGLMHYQNLALKEVA